ncbi:hypothetical protein O0L34_g14002 [Tuta absoluta]|nr:hypothetical protein O0L34_g14002 [Tuta absoluta]
MAESTAQFHQFENGLRSPVKIPVQLGKSFSKRVAIQRNLFTNLIGGFSVVFLCAVTVGYPMHSTFKFGFHLLAVRGLLNLSYAKGWLTRFGVKDNRRPDWYLQIYSSGLIGMGSIFNILTEDIQWLSFYGQFVISALIFDCNNVLGGFLSLWLLDL